MDTEAKLRLQRDAVREVNKDLRTAATAVLMRHGCEGCPACDALRKLIYPTAIVSQVKN